MESQIITSKIDTDVYTTHFLTQEHLTQYQEDGYVIVRGLFDLEEVGLVRAICEKDLNLNDPDISNSLKTVIDENGKSWHLALWTGLNDSLFSVMTRTARMVNIAEQLIGEKCYHWQSKVVQKRPHDDSLVGWHQGYFYWYNECCLFPNFATCTIAITENTKAHGCLQIIKKSHLMGRIDHPRVGNVEICDSKRVNKALEKLEIVDCEMAPGDAVFFHGNTIHGSQQNTTNDTRILMHCHYNAVSNQPFEEKHQKNHPYIPLEKLPDSVIKHGLYKSEFNVQNADYWVTFDE